MNMPNSHNRGEILTTDTPEAPAAAPNPSLSDAEEATLNLEKKSDAQSSPRKRTRRRISKPATAPPTIEELFGVNSDTWTRFYTITIAGDLDNVEIFDELNKTLKDDFDCYRRKDGAIIIDAKTKRNSEAIQKLTKILNKDMTTARDPQLNSVRGTILVPLTEFRDQGDLDTRICNHLNSQNIPVSNVKLFKKTSRKKTTLLCACITFESRTLPSIIRIGFERVKVKEDIPKPRQCRGCWRFGHNVDNCRSPPCCPICGSGTHAYDNCHFKGDKLYKGHCPNCDGDGHTAFSKMCNLYRKEAEILVTMYRQGLPKNKAKRLVEDMGSVQEFHTPGEQPMASIHLPLAKMFSPFKNSSNQISRAKQTNKKEADSHSIKTNNNSSNNPLPHHKHRKSNRHSLSNSLLKPKWRHCLEMNKNHSSQWRQNPGKCAHLKNLSQKYCNTSQIQVRNGNLRRHFPNPLPKRPKIILFRPINGKTTQQQRNVIGH